ncbi:MAG: glutamyl-tRNA reductase [Desulfosalsimonadaceae bacterium]
MTNLPGGNGESIMVPDKGPDPSHILLIGMNHKTAPVEMREKLAFSPEEAAAALNTFRSSPGIVEAMIISTCNRVEVILIVKNLSRAVDIVFSYMGETKSISPDRLKTLAYVFSGDRAVRHVFRVAASLDSMMIGEPQILGQVKDAFKASVIAKTTGVILNRLMHKAFSVAKRVRSETGIGGHAVSISYAAVELAKKIFDTLDDKTVLLVGAGEMAELAVEHLIRNAASGNLLVANRTFSAGVALAERFNGSAIRLEEIPEKLKIADIIISSTGSPNYVITRSQVQPIMRSRRNRPLFFIDIAVPRDIDPAINRLDNAYVYDIDDLQGVISENIETRQAESVKAERIVDESVIKFIEWLGHLDVVPTIIGLRKKLDTIAAAEMEKTLHSLNHLSSDDRQAIERMTEAMVKKILHDPALFLKNPGSHRNKSVYLDFARKLFNLDN